VSALDALVDEAARTRGARGPHAAGAVDVDRLGALLRRAVERGVSEADLADALAKLEALRQPHA
jgi:hypothetical protein